MEIIKDTNIVKIYDALLYIINSRGYDYTYTYTINGMTREEYIKSHNLDMTGWHLAPKSDL